MIDIVVAFHIERHLIVFPHYDILPQVPKIQESPTE